MKPWLKIILPILFILLSNAPSLLAQKKDLPTGTLKKKGTVYVATYKNTEFKFVLVEGGTFTMGCTDEMGECVDDEKPTHRVTLNSFYLGKTEVTQAQWQAVMGNNPSRFKNCPNCPVEVVSWEDVKDFMVVLNRQTGSKIYRLPTEAEWEYAARGGNKPDGTKYGGAFNPDKVAWHGGNSGGQTHEVAQKQPNGLGLYDMSGNVWEWCEDWYGTYPESAQTNPQGPDSGGVRVFRGGSWRFNARSCRVSSRIFDAPSSRGNVIGFRLLRAVTP